MRGRIGTPGLKYGLSLLPIAAAAIAALLGGHTWIGLGAVAGCVSMSALFLSARQDKITFKARERELQDEARMAEDIIAAIPSGLVGLDRKGNVCRWNEGATRILGIGRGGIVGHHVDRWPIDGQKGIQSLLKDALGGKTVKRGSLDVMRSDGQGIPLGISTSSLGGDGAGGGGAVALFQDLTEVHKIRDKMKQQERLAAIGTLAASIAHEIRNPLASIAGSVELLSGELKLENEHAELFDLIMKESDRLNKLITSFLEFTRDRQPEFTTVDASSLLEDSLRTVRLQAECGPEMELSVKSDEGLGCLWADSAMLKQVFLNLIINACQAASWRGAVELSAGDCEENGIPGVRFTCRDSGPGIPASVRERLFEPFFSTRAQGTGLGLPIARRIVELHGGRLELLDEEGEGSAFTFRIAGEALREKAEWVEQSSTPELMAIS